MLRGPRAAPPPSRRPGCGSTGAPRRPRAQPPAAPAASRPHREGSPKFVNDWVSWGAGLRAAQFLSLGAKARTLLQGRAHVTTEDIQALAAPVLRHRVLVNYRAEAEGISAEGVIDKLLEEVPAP